MMNNPMHVRPAVAPVQPDPKRMEEAGFIEDAGFTFDGFQVVRGEYFAHTYEPSICFNQYKISVNKSCIKRMPHVEYVQLLINPNEKKVVIRPSSEDEKGSFRWRVKSSLNPRYVSCRVFFARLAELMGWNLDYRYKLLGRMVMSRSEYLYVFDLTEPEIYQRLPRDPATGKVIRGGNRRPMYPEDWKNHFGLPVEENRKSLQISLYNGYTVFSLKENTPIMSERKDDHANGNAHYSV